MKNVKKLKKSWINGFFDDEDVQIHFSSRKLPEIQWFLKYLQLDSVNDLKVFEQCCGTGDILNIFQENGANVFGIDISSKSVDQAKKQYPKISERVFCDDARNCFFMTCDIVLNYFSSFGYFEQDSENEKLLIQASKSLKNGGLFLLEMPDFEYLLNNFKKDFKDGVFIRKSKIKNGFLIQNWIGPKKFKTKIKIYSKEEMKKILNRHFQDVSLYKENNRLIWVCKKTT